MKHHLGSTAALVLGVLTLASGASRPSSLFFAGLVIILGALAYRSAKKRKLGEVKDRALRKGLEMTAILFIIADMLLQHDMKHAIATDPIPNLIIPFWAITAYAFIFLRKTNHGQTKEGFL